MPEVLPLPLLVAVPVRVLPELPLRDTVAVLEPVPAGDCVKLPVPVSDPEADRVPVLELVEVVLLVRVAVRPLL